MNRLDAIVYDVSDRFNKNDYCKVVVLILLAILWGMNMVPYHWCSRTMYLEAAIDL